MAISEAFLIVLRYLVAAGMGWLVQRGLLAADTSTLVDAATTIASGIIGWAAMVLWALWRSRFRAKLQDVLAHRGVSTVHADPETAASMNLPGVIATPPATP